LKAVCDKNCFTCPYEDCICDELTYEDFKAEKEIDLLSGAKEYKTSPKARAAQKRYYEENKEKVAAAQKRYYEENKEKWKLYNQKQKEKKHGRNQGKDHQAFRGTVLREMGQGAEPRPMGRAIRAI